MVVATVALAASVASVALLIALVALVAALVVAVVALVVVALVVALSPLLFALGGLDGRGRPHSAGGGAAATLAAPTARRADRSAAATLNMSRSVSLAAPSFARRKPHPAKSGRFGQA